MFATIHHTTVHSIFFLFVLYFPHKVDTYMGIIAAYMGIIVLLAPLVRPNWIEGYKFFQIWSRFKYRVGAERWENHIVGRVRSVIQFLSLPVGITDTGLRYFLV